MVRGYVPLGQRRPPFADPNSNPSPHGRTFLIEEIIPPIPFSEIRRAIRETLPNLLASSKGDERNVLLTFSRMWTRELTSKDVAALWAESRVPEPFATLLAKARNAYLGNVVDDLTNVEPEVSQLCGILQDQILKEE